MNQPWPAVWFRKRLQQERHDQHQDRHVDAAQPGVEHDEAEQGRDRHRHGEPDAERRPGVAVALDEVDPGDAVGVAAEAEECALPQAQDAAEAPHHAEAERQEHVGEEVRDVQQLVAREVVGRRRTRRDHREEAQPEAPVAAHLVGPVEAAEDPLHHRPRTLTRRRSIHSEMPAGIRRMITKASTSIATWPSRMLNWFTKTVFAKPRESTLASRPVMTSATAADDHGDEGLRRVAHCRRRGRCWR